MTDKTIDTVYPNLKEDIIPKNSLYDDIKKNVIIQKIILEVQKLPEYSKYRTDLELISYIVNQVENMITKKKQGALKKEIVLAIFQKLFNITPQEIKLLSDCIDYLGNNKQIKKLSIYKKYLKPIGKYIIKKFA
jgi:hypothetical protein